MVARSPYRTWIWACAVGAIAAQGCGDDGTTPSTGVDTTSSSSSSSSGAGGAGGGSAVDNGHPSSETVSAGDMAKSPSYTMVFTFGQPTQNQGKTTSAGYRMQGGLVGANGSLP